MVVASLRRAPAAAATYAVEAYNRISQAVRGGGGLPSFRYQALAIGPGNPTSPPSSSSSKPKPSTTTRKVAALLIAYLALLGIALLAVAHYQYDFMTESHNASDNNSNNDANSDGQDVLPETSSSPPSSSLDLLREDFIAAVMAGPVEGYMDPTPVRKKCDGTVFQEGLVWHCHEASGGIGNAESMFLNCVRYAIEAGATSLILPRLSSRDLEDLYSFGTNGTIALSQLFDVDHFIASLHEACPQIHTFESDTDLDLPPIEQALHLNPAAVKNFDLIRGLTIVDPAGWREAFDSWCLAQPACAAKSPALPVRVWQQQALFQWNNLIDEPDFVRNFARLFRLPRDTRALAASVLWGMQTKLNRPVLAPSIFNPSTNNNNNNNTPDPLVSSLFNSPPSHTPRLAPNGFFGAHLRTAADAVKAGWPGYSAQAPYYIAQARKQGLDTIYIASGSPPHVQQFRDDAVGFAVYTKLDLLDHDPGARAALEDMSWDRQALVDFDVLMYSTYFYGFVRSSFSWQLAIRRATVPGSGHKRVGKDLPEEDSFRDDITAMTGHHNVAFEKGVWP